MATNQQAPRAMFQPQVGDAIQFDPAVPGGYINTKTGQRYAPGTLFALNAGGKHQYFVAAPNGQGHYTIDPSSGDVKDQGSLGKYLLKAGLGVAGFALGAGAAAGAIGAGSGAAAAGASKAAPMVDDTGAPMVSNAPNTVTPPPANSSAISSFAQWSPWLSAAASVYGAYQTGQAQDAQIAEAKREFDVQAAFNQQQADLAKARHDALVAREAPYVSGGTAAYGRLGDLLGLSPAGSLSGPSMQAPAPAPTTTAPAGMPPTAPPSAPPMTMPPSAPPTSSGPAGAPTSLAAFAAQPSPSAVTFKAPDGTLGTLTDPEQIRRAMADTRLQRVS